MKGSGGDGSTQTRQRNERASGLSYFTGRNQNDKNYLDVFYGSTDRGSVKSDTVFEEILERTDCS
jgi:hypothetical protein